MSITAVSSTAAVMVCGPPPTAIAQRIKGSWAITSAAGRGRRRVVEVGSAAGTGSAASPRPYAVQSAVSTVAAAAAKVTPSPAGNATSCSA